MTERNLADST